jgi:enamine deaminase RidA (YjgF/YER057c/UK114 family)
MGVKGKRGLGPVMMGGKPMPWGKGAVAGDFVFLSGLEGRTDDAGVAVDGIAAQTKLALERGTQYLQEAGTSAENVVRMVQYLAKPEDAAEFHVARDGWMRAHAPQLLEEQSYAGVLLIQQFTKPDRLIEIELTAYIDQEGA